MRSRRTLAIGVTVVTVTLGAMGLQAQAVLSRLGVSETHAHEISMSAILGSYYPGTVKPFLALAGAARGAAVGELVAWAKAYYSSAAFKKVWAEQRDSAKPSAPDAKGTVDDEMKAKDADVQKQMAEMQKVIAQMPADQRPAMEAIMKQTLAATKDPATVAATRQMITAQRAEDQKRYQDDLKKWGEDYPLDPNVVIARRLHEFLSFSADVNFDAKLVARDGRQVFADPKYESKSSNWKMCYRAGRDATQAARAAATAWLKELGK